MDNTNNYVKRKYRSNFDNAGDTNALEANFTDQERLEVKHYLKTTIGVLNLLAIVNDKIYSLKFFTQFLFL